MMQRPNNMFRHRIFDCRLIPRVTGLLCGFIIGVNVARADCPPEPPPETKATDENGLLAAQALFSAGIALSERNDCSGALTYFLQSRAVARRMSSTWNAAHCLNLLQRYPEALAFYEEVRRDFYDTLNDTQKKEIEGAIQDLRSKIVVAKIEESSGLYAVDGKQCGELPRTQPIYLFPGEHRLQIWQRGRAEASLIFQGMPGEKIPIRLPPVVPLPVVRLPVVPLKGQWFVQGTASVGWGGTKSSEFIGFLAQTRDGYRFPNQLSLALVLGMFYGMPTLDSEDSAYLPSGENDDTGVVKPYFIRRAPLFGPFMGVSTGWEPRVDENFNAMFRVGIGVMGMQSKNEIDIVRGNNRYSVDDDKGVLVRGRDVVRSVPPYATFDVGLMFHRKQLYLGLSLGVFILLDDVPLKPEAPVRFEENNRVNTITFSAEKRDEIERGFFFLPQIVVGFDP
jgi:hypothetical protein